MKHKLTVYIYVNCSDQMLWQVSSASGALRWNRREETTGRARAAAVLTGERIVLTDN